MPTTHNSHTQDTPRLHMVSLKKMCNQAGTPELFPTIRNSIGLYCKEHSDLWTHIYSNKNDKSDVYLTGDGIQAFGAILVEYFGEKEISLLQGELRKRS